MRDLVSPPLVDVSFASSGQRRENGCRATAFSDEGVLCFYDGEGCIEARLCAAPAPAKLEQRDALT